MKKACDYLRGIFTLCVTYSVFSLNITQNEESHKLTYILKAVGCQGANAKMVDLVITSRVFMGFGSDMTSSRTSTHEEEK